ncbi:CAMK family protein kinase [Tritrichomonas foetus]|uniref:CAMK family protein kinase n=1 Tax=Tritrichomonas foetus TaxID=1144522 RepID=A0A1J4L3M9_9EUKA|nr:CAMK family protein kinase [Tritrichomonas foetus]|eukprot:OHT16525.1 CAMK family protein kinase [Tritrichomonas foetus]
MIREIFESLDLKQNQIIQTLSEHQYTYRRPLSHLSFGRYHLIYSEKYHQEFVVEIIVGPPKHKNGNTEVTALVTLIHQNIIHLYEYFSDDELLYLILEYCPGGNLEEYVKSNGPLKSQKLYLICKQLISALDYSHSLKIPHCDIRPANILIDVNDRPKIIGFGKMHPYDDPLPESRPYMAPEKISYSSHDPMKADIWSLGVCFYYLATGELPWQTKTESSLRTMISIGKIPSNTISDQEFLKIIKKMVRVAPNQRVDWKTIMSEPIFNIEKKKPQKKVTLYLSKSLDKCTIFRTVQPQSGQMSPLANDPGQPEARPAHLSKCGSVISFQKSRISRGIRKAKCSSLYAFIRMSEG